MLVSPNMTFEIGYYRAKDRVELGCDAFIDQGDLICIHEVRDGLYWFRVGLGDSESTRGLSETELARDFVPVDEAAAMAERSALIKSLNEEICSHHSEAQNAKKSLNSAEGLLLGSTVPSTSSQSEHLVMSGDSAMGQAKAEIAAARFSISEASVKLRKAQGLLKRVLGEQSLLAEGRLKDLEKMISGMQEVIVMVNLYLGRDEQIVPIRDGEPAASGDPVCFRQRLLYMDEECLLAITRGGLDFEDLSDFDSWLCQPDNLQHILPETKGVIALKVRRKALLKSTNVIENMVANEENFRVYFLIRNGEKLWRITNELDLGDNLFPTQKEFDDLYLIRDRSSGEVERVRPGSRDYYAAMKLADKKQRSYMRVLLMLQGLIDRTRIFVGRGGGQLPVNLMDPSTFGESCRFIRDNELTLDSGRPQFNDWLNEVNSRLEPGMRICGEFRNYETRSSFREEDRVRPLSAGLPDSHTLYTIVERGGSQKVLFENEFSGFGRGGKMRRASFRIERSDHFFINFDAVEVDDLRFYLNDRRNRSNYLTMIPLLDRCIELKEAERAIEEPFVSLLQSELIRKLRRDIPAEEVRELVDWWKFKTKSHRAILSDDSKALRMILKEYRLKSSRESDFRDILKLKDSVAHLWDSEKVLLAAHKTGRELVILEKASDWTALVHETTWIVDPDGGAHCKDQKQWTAVDFRYKRWNVLFEGSDWTEWPKDLKAKDYPTDSEIKLIQEQITLKSEHLFLLLFQGSSFLSFSFDPSSSEPLCYGSGWVQEKCFGSSEWLWERTSDGFSVKKSYFSKPLIFYSKPSWGSDDDECWIWNHPGYKDSILHFDPAVGNLIVERFKNDCLKLSRDRRIADVAFNFRLSMVEDLEKRWKRLEYDRFTTDGGHPDLFEDHLKTLKHPSFPHQLHLPHEIEEFVAAVFDNPPAEIELQAVLPGYVRDDAVFVEIDGGSYSWPVEFLFHWPIKT